MTNNAAGTDAGGETPSRMKTKSTSAAPNLHDYERFVVAFSGGKDSLASLLHLLERLDSAGIPRDRVELWHHEIDGDSQRFMDWPVTRAYCIAVARALSLPIYFSWRAGGFEGEMMREDAPTGDVVYEAVGGGLVVLPSKQDSLGTRLRFPMPSADLSVRWCSAYLKIDVMARVMRNDVRFQDGKTLVLTGERAQESAARSKYATFEPHRADLRNGKRAPRHIDHWRNVLAWDETQVWATIQRHGIVPHPAYRMGFGRVSCAFCIFGNANQWASAARVLPCQAERVATRESASDRTIKQGTTVPALIADGTPYPFITDELASLAAGDEYREPVLVHPDEWELPAGAFADTCGPT